MFKTKWLLIFFSLLLILGFFIPWVQWATISIPGFAMPAGDFFMVSGQHFGLDNPFPRFGMLMVVFWLIPVAAIAVIGMAWLNRSKPWIAVVAGVLALSLATVYILFTNTLVDLGVGRSLISSLRFGIYLTVIAAMGLILAGTRLNIFLKTGLLIAGPVLVWIGFTLITRHLEGEKYDDTANIESVHSINALDLIREFQSGDSLANAKYREKILTVRGRVSETELSNDSTVIVKISDTTGSYAIFSFEDNYLEPAKKLVSGDSVEIKGSCSGGIYSEILETRIITFKRCALLNTN